MLRPVRRAAVVVLAIGAALGVAVAAWADEPPDWFDTTIEESGDGPGYEVGAESGQSTPGSSGAGGESSGGGAAAAEVEPSECDLDPACDTFTEPGLGGDGAAAVEPLAVAYSARDSLALPDPQIATSPGPDVPVLVQVPVWLWIDGDAWEEQAASAEVPGGSVSVTASPVRSEWSMGDGATVTCEGPGVAYDPAVHDPAGESPECGHTYTRASAGEPDGAFALEVDVVWEVSWESSDGDGGDLGELVTSAETERSVIESHGLVTAVD